MNTPDVTPVPEKESPVHQEKDVQYCRFGYRVNEIEHHYPKNVHILSDPFLMTHLTRLCSPDTYQPRVGELINTIYQNLVRIVINAEYPLVEVDSSTRMIEHTPQGRYRGNIIDPGAKTVVVNIARAGTVPAQICYTAFNYILDPQEVRQDHISMNRETDQDEQVTGVRVGGSKIGGPVEDAMVVFPDPMGATGGSLCRAVSIYKDDVPGVARKYVALHLIVTPEYIRKMTETHPDVAIYAIRLDRGLSSPEVLSSVPGQNWDDECGLNEHQYIVPGGGGFGEILNNSFV